jgi:hypothetical protein
MVRRMLWFKSKRTCTCSNLLALSFARQKDMCYVTTSILSYTQNPRTSYTAANDDFCFQAIEWLSKTAFHARSPPVRPAVRASIMAAQT